MKRIFFACVLGLIVLAASGWFLLFTGAGLRVLAGLAGEFTANSVVIGSSTGSITGRWLLRDVLVTTDAADIRIGAISCDWQPRRLIDRNLHIADLTISRVRISVKHRGNAADAAGEPLQLPAVALPLPVLIGRLQIDDVEVVDASAQSIFDARSLSARLEGDGEHVKISEVNLAAPYLGGSGEARLDMAGDWPLTLNADWWARVEGCTRFSGSFEAGGSVVDPLLQVALKEPEALQIDVEISALFDEFRYQATVSGPQAALSSFCVKTPVVLDDLLLTVAGDRERYSGSAEAAVALADDLAANAYAAFSGNRERLQIDAGHVSRGSNRLDIAGSLNFGSGLGWNAAVSTRALDLSAVLPVPETLIDGDLDIYGEVEGGLVSYTADLHDLGIAIRERNITIGGGLSLHGDQHGLEISSSNFVCGEGTIGVQGGIGWRDGFVWEADILLDSFDPSVIDLLPNGNVSGSLTSSGSFEDSQLSLQAEIESLSGDLSGYELAGEGLVVYRNHKLSVRELNITSGNNSFQAEGQIDTDYDLAFRVNGSELERIFPLLGGVLVVEGTMSGPRSGPLLDISAAGKDLSYEDYRIDELRADAVADFGSETLRGDFDLVRVAAQTLRAEQLSVELDGSMAEHAISAELILPRTTLSMHAGGSVLAGRWRGEIDKLRVDDDRFGSWLNDDHVLISAGTGSFTVDGACLSSGANRLCADLNWGQGNAWSVALDQLRFDLGSLNRWGVLEKPLTGIIAGQLSAVGAGSVIQSMSGNAGAETVQWEPGPNRYYQDFIWRDTSCSFSLDGGDLAVDLATGFVDGSSLDGTIVLPGVMDFDEVGQIPLSGRVNLNLKDLGPLSTLTGEFLVPQGQVSGTVEIGGTLGAPRVLGDADLQGDGFHIPLLGVDITDVQGTVGFDDGRLSLDLDSRAGEGRLSSTGSFEFGSEEWSGHLRFAGSNCTLLNRRAISVEANPRLELDLGPQGGSLTGAVEVLRALVEVEKIDRSATESSDVVFVDKAIESTPWPFRYDIAVTLGEDVKVEGFGLTAQLVGDLVVANNPDGTMVGRGFLDVKQGSFVVYGSPLTIARGRLFFDGGPVDNPGIDIKASKFIDERRSGYEKIEVGANVIGSAADFEVELYSIPAMEKNNILTYLLFDNPFSKEGDDGTTGLITSAARALGLGKGSELLGDVNSMLPVDQIRFEGGLDTQETSLVVGKNLSKELSVSYDYNLFKNDGSFRVRYEFGKGFSVESRNSFESNAVELMYSFER